MALISFIYVNGYGYKRFVRIPSAEVRAVEQLWDMTDGYRIRITLSSMDPISIYLVAAVGPDHKVTTAVTNGILEDLMMPDIDVDVTWTMNMKEGSAGYGYAWERTTIRPQSNLG